MGGAYGGMLRIDAVVDGYCFSHLSHGLDVVLAIHVSPVNNVTYS